MGIEEKSYPSCNDGMKDIGGFSSFKQIEKEDSWICLKCGYLIQHQEYFLDEEEVEEFRESFK